MVTVCLGVAWSRGTILVPSLLCSCALSCSLSVGLADAGASQAMHVSLSGDEVSFYVTRNLLVAVDRDGALRTWYLHAQVKSVNGCLKLVDGAPTHYGVPCRRCRM
jgi:hypothetical protein